MATEPQARHRATALQQSVSDPGHRKASGPAPNSAGPMPQTSPKRIPCQKKIRIRPRLRMHWSGIASSKLDPASHQGHRRVCSSPVGCRVGSNCGLPLMLSTARSLQSSVADGATGPAPQRCRPQAKNEPQNEQIKRTIRIRPKFGPISLVGDRKPKLFGSILATLLKLGPSSRVRQMGGGWQPRLGSPGRHRSGAGPVPKTSPNIHDSLLQEPLREDPSDCSDFVCRGSLQRDK